MNRKQQKEMYIHFVFSQGLHIASMDVELKARVMRRFDHQQS